MADSYFRVPGALERDSQEVWQTASEDVLAIVGRLPEVPAWVFGPFLPEVLASLLDVSRSTFENYLNGASSEFLQFEARLLEAEIVYLKFENATQAEIERVRAMIDV